MNTEEPSWWKSKKLVALALGIGAIMMLTAGWIVADAFWHINSLIVQTAVTAISTLTGVHITGQTAVDRAQAYSPNYPVAPVTTPAPPPALPSPPDKTQLHIP